MSNDLIELVVDHGCILRMQEIPEDHCFRDLNNIRYLMIEVDGELYTLVEILCEIIDYDDTTLDEIDIIIIHMSNNALDSAFLNENSDIGSFI